MDQDKKTTESPEEFLSRWSRRKQQAREQEAAPSPAVTPASQDQPPELPPVDALNMDSDFRGFLHPKVDETLRREALKKLFHEPHFNVMDGLDIYIDDYSVSDPIPEAMLKQMKHAQDIIVAGKERREEAARQEEAERQRLAAAAEGEHAAAAPPEIAPEPAVPSDEVTAPVQNSDTVTPQR